MTHILFQFIQRFYTQYLVAQNFAGSNFCDFSSAQEYKFPQIKISANISPEKFTPE